MAKKKDFDMDEVYSRETEDRTEDSIRDEASEEFSYRPVSELSVPEEIRERFYGLGYYLKWVRYTINNVVDIQNIRRRQKEGYSFVTPEEIGPEAELMGQSESLERFGDIVTVGDLALMKIPDFKAEGRRKYFRGETKKQADAINAKLSQNQIQNGSYTRIRTGKFAHFSGD